MRYDAIYNVVWMFNNKYMNLLRYKFNRNERNRLYGWNSSVIEALCSQPSDLDMIKSLFVTHRHCFQSSSILRAAKEGNLATVMFLDENGLVYIPEQVIFAAIQSKPISNIDIINFIISKYRDRSNGEDGESLPPLQLSVCIESAAGLGNLHLVQYLFSIKSNQEEVSHRAIDKASQNGHIAMVAYLHTLNQSCTTDAMDEASKNGHLHLVQFLHRNRFEGCTKEAMDGAARNGRLDIVKWLHENRTEGCTKKAMDDAAGAGAIDVVMFLHYNRSEGCTTAAIDNASVNGHLDVVKFLMKNRDEYCTNSAINIASEKGYLEIVKFLRSYNMDYTSYAGEWAAYYGHYDLVEYLLRMDSSKIKDSALNFAASAGHVHILEMLMKTRCTISAMAVDQSVANGHLEVLKILYPSIKPSCISKIFERGYLGIVKFLHENYCKLFSRESLDLSAKNGHLKVVKFLHSNRTEGCSSEALDLSAGNGHFKVLQFLHYNRTESASVKAMNLAARNGFLDIVYFLHKERTEGCTTAAIDGACSNGYLDVVMFLHRERKEGCTQKALLNAANGGFLEIVQFLVMNRTEHHGVIQQAINQAAARNYLEVVEFLHRYYKSTENNNTDIIWADDVIEKSIRLGHLGVIMYLHFNTTIFNAINSAKLLGIAIARKQFELAWFLYDKVGIKIDLKKFDSNINCYFRECVQLMRNDSWGQLFFIPLIKVNSGTPFLHCPTCGATIPYVEETIEHVENPSDDLQFKPIEEKKKKKHGFLHKKKKEKDIHQQELQE
eukprot:gene516-651_t